MMIDNLLKRSIEKPDNCLFCDEKESINHLFFYCVVAKRLWEYVKAYSNIAIADYESLA